MTLEEAGVKMHVTRERIRQIEAQALKKMRQKASRLEEEALTRQAQYLSNLCPRK
ncbi:MAG: RNA polymerase sigma factor [Candidatus Daviesbacteria bacterium GW2011_GWB1_41_5]|uniref:RNA polymerase sigma factor n=1 Tax=Candidatus Daviesbacteria bacterium GW2011_GWB1_41_5 TaxID=1618429 RepID=A0A0G0ZIK0_9BACT|nr:MAG: RNA polymerase sigma factor [Candidatus Daviesbacteria bacterium GW2011_GWB1_41_5]